MSFRRKIASLVLATAALTAAGLAAAAPARAGTTGDPQGMLRNAESGLCIDWPGGLNPSGYQIAKTSACTGAPTQQWTYSDASHTFRNSGTAYCLATANTSAVLVVTCDGGWFQHWGFTGDGRIHQLDWTVGCVKGDTSWGYTYWGQCTGSPDEVWELAAA